MTVIYIQKCVSVLHAPSKKRQITVQVTVYSRIMSSEWNMLLITFWRLEFRTAARFCEIYGPLKLIIFVDLFN